MGKVRVKVRIRVRIRVRICSDQGKGEYLVRPGWGVEMWSQGFWVRLTDRARVSECVSSVVSLA